MITNTNYIAIRILLAVAEFIADYSLKSEIQATIRDIREVMKEQRDDESKAAA